MRIALDARSADGPPTGISCYVRTLVEALAMLPDACEYLLLRCSPEGAPRLVEDPRFEEARSGAGDLWMEMNLGPLLAEWGADVYHATVAAPPVVGSRATLMTVHDVIPRVMPEAVEDTFRAYFEARMAVGFRRAHHLLAVSSHTAHDLTHLCGIAPDRISVVREAAPVEHTAPVALTEAKLAWASYGVRQPFVLYVGAIEPRKNIPRLLHAFRLLCSRTSCQAQLVLVGAARDRAAETAEQVRSALRELPAVWIQSVNAATLRALYAGATVFVFPSLYEGFGLPVLEAMCHGLPVIVSFTSSLPEVVGEAGLLVDPYDAGAIAGAVQQVLADEALRKLLSTRARRRGAELSLPRMGEGTLRAYRRAVAARG